MEAMKCESCKSVFYFDEIDFTEDNVAARGEEPAYQDIPCCPMCGGVDLCIVHICSDCHEESNHLFANRICKNCMDELVSNEAVVAHYLEHEELTTTFLEYIVETNPDYLMKIIKDNLKLTADFILNDSFEAERFAEVEGE